MKYIDNKIVYEVGDWIVGHTEECGRITRIRKDGKYLYYNVDGAGDHSSYPESSRPATQEEIDKVEQPIMVGGYEVQFKGYYPEGEKDMDLGNLKCTKIIVGCIEINKETFLKIKQKAGW